MPLQFIALTKLGSAVCGYCDKRNPPSESLKQGLNNQAQHHDPGRQHSNMSPRTVLPRVLRPTAAQKLRLFPIWKSSRWQSANMTQLGQPLLNPLTDQ